MSDSNLKLEASASADTELAKEDQVATRSTADALSSNRDDEDSALPGNQQPAEAGGIEPHVAGEREGAAVKIRVSGKLISKLGSMITSLLLHAAFLLVLALLTLSVDVPQRLAISIDSELMEEKEELEQAQSLTTSEFTMTSVEGVATESQNSSALGEFATLQTPTHLAEDLVDYPPLQITANVGSSSDPSEIEQLATQIGDGTAGLGRVVVDNYDQAFDRLTWEILTMLQESKVLVIWCFDQSVSMKDDQEVIRDRIELVYAELGLSEIAQSKHLMTAISSFGEDFMIHLRKPTDDVELMRTAIDEIPSDPSGKEMMCSAIGKSIQHYQKYAKRTRRQIALVLVSDESGNRADNDSYLEDVIELARESSCRIYVLGREAVFGYPYAHMEWQHPQTKVVHYLPVDRGPESGFLEQLQTDGFQVRYDSHPSGYGPYEQSRLASETGGIFFMLPNVELNVVGLDKRRYRLDKMQFYEPDLHHRALLMEEINDNIFRSGLLKIIYDLNPYDEVAAKIIVMRTVFSNSPPEFVKQVQIELAKIITYMNYLDRMRTALEELWYLRNQDSNSRWKANADLMRAQLLAYKIRLYEYGAYLSEFVKNPKVVPLMPEPNVHLIHWSVARRQEMITGDVTSEYVRQAKKWFAAVIENHPETPWAGRAEKEMSSGFGIELFPYYQRRPAPGPSRPSRPSAPSRPTQLIPIPKL